MNLSSREIKKLLGRAIDDAIKDGYKTFITGMARGVDMWAAEIVLRKKKFNPNIHLICTPPYDGFEKNWRSPEKILYNKILNKADFVKFVCKNYSRSCFQIRNVYMVDNSSRVIAVFTGQSGGTKNTVDYANKKGIEIVNVLDESLSE